MKNAVKKIKLTAKRKTVKAGKKLTVKAKVTTTGKKVNKTLAWSSSNEKYATVNKEGCCKSNKSWSRQDSNDHSKIYRWYQQESNY